ncbi:MAG: acyl-CoA desaturase [Polyangiales bacterium]
MQADVLTREQRAMSRLSIVLTWLMHILCLAVFFVPFSWKLVGLAVASYFVRMWSITAGYHRYFSHRSYKTSRAFQFFLAWMGTSAMQNGPLWWTSWHRRHHRYSDTVDDAHSPIQGGFWHAHMGWFIDGSHDYPDLSNVRDFSRFPELRFIDKYKWMPLVMLGAICYAIAGTAGLVWGLVVSSVVLLHVTACINSLAHVWGSRRFETSDTSRNNWLLAIFTLGEGWHNNHHHLQSSTKQGVAWYELDVCYITLWVLSKLGIVWDLRTHASIAAKRSRSLARVDSMADVAIVSEGPLEAE